jgi:hypothetical protein
LILSFGEEFQIRFRSLAYSLETDRFAFLSVGIVSFWVRKGEFAMDAG